MNKSFEQLWTTLLNSDSFRRFAKRGPGSALFRSKAYLKLNTAMQFIASYYNVRQSPGLFQEVGSYCVFIGHNKSGTSMIGSLLDAHPSVALSDEVDALQYVSAGFSRDQLFHIVLRGSRREFIKGRVTARRLQPYSYLVPGQWQGRFDRLKVIGDSTSGSSTRRLAADPELMQRLQKLMGEINVKFIQVIRNPYDPISVMMVRGKRTFENAIEHYFNSCDALIQIRENLQSPNLVSMKYENFIYDPEANLIKICTFLGLEADEDYLKACAKILYKTPVKSRQLVEWEPGWIEVVKRKMHRYDFLQGYSFDE
jgi:hypothetical protein